MHRGKKRVPTHRFSAKQAGGTIFAYLTGIAKGKRAVDVDERRMRGYPSPKRKKDVDSPQTKE